MYIDVCFIAEICHKQCIPPQNQFFNKIYGDVKLELTEAVKALQK